MNDKPQALDAHTPPVPPTRIDFSAQDRAWIAEHITEVLTTGRLTMGPYGERFELDFAAFTGARHAVAVSSGTSALEISLRVLDVAGKDVLVPANTFFATAAAVLAAGGRPVLMDADARTMSTSADELARRITPNTVGAIIVHIAGFVTDEMAALAAAAKARGLWLLEDAAHAHGATQAGRHAGCFGIAGTFSFYPTKVMTAAEGGMIITNDDRLAAEARLYRDQGKASFHENRHVRLGSNWRLSEPHAVIGLRHLSHLPAMVAARRRIAAIFDAALTTEDLSLAPISAPPGCVANYYKYPAMLADHIDRAAFKAYLKDRHGIACSGEVYEAPLHRHPVFADLDSGDLGQAERLCARHVCLPVFASMTDDDAHRTLAALRAAKQTFG
ncbi:MAG: DegT/DnrJ/EryC1/StrS family aminotransferase [Sphingomonadales bacterium]